jgi:hypothetical protein
MTVGGRSCRSDENRTGSDNGDLSRWREKGRTTTNAHRAGCDEGARWGATTEEVASPQTREPI